MKRKITPAKAGKREIQLSFSPKQWADIAAGAAFDGSTPERWARDVVLAFIPETLDAIRRAKMTPAARDAEDTEAARKSAAMLPIVASQAISLSEDQTRATALCAAWEGMTFASFCRMGIFSWLECSFADMQGFATGREGFRHAGRKEKAWARKWHKEAAPIMARLGWDGMSLQDSPADFPATHWRNGGTAWQDCASHTPQKASRKRGGKEGLKHENKSETHGPASGPGNRNGGLSHGAGMEKIDVCL